MRGERALLRAGEYLVGRACLRLPPGIRDERFREWAAELPAILHDPEIRPAARRAVRMLGYAADTLRGTALSPGRGGRRPAAHTAVGSGLLTGLTIASLGLVAWSSWDLAQHPGYWVNYVRVAWALLLVASPVSQYGRSTTRMTGLIIVSTSLAGVVDISRDLVRAPGDWVNYLVVACLSLGPVAWWLAVRWGRRRGRQAGHGGQAAAP